MLFAPVLGDKNKNLHSIAVYKSINPVNCLYAHQIKSGYIHGGIFNITKNFTAVEIDYSLVYYAENCSNVMNEKHNSWTIDCMLKYVCLKYKQT